VSSLAFSPSGRHMLCGCRDKKVSVYSSLTLNQVAHWVRFLCLLAPSPPSSVLSRFLWRFLYGMLCIDSLIVLSVYYAITWQRWCCSSKCKVCAYVMCKVCHVQREVCGVQEQVKSLCKMHLVCVLQQEVWHLCVCCNKRCGICVCVATRGVASVCVLQQEVWHVHEALHQALLKVCDVQQALREVLHLQQAFLCC